jgi:PilZ domain-containing protein
MQMPNHKIDTSNQTDEAVPVVIWGTGANGEIFREHANAKELTSDGAVLTGIGHQVAKGDLVGVQYKNCKAHARVIGISQAETDHYWSLWVKLLENSRCPWAGLDRATPSNSHASARMAERRRSLRFGLNVPLHIQKSDDYSPSFMITKDISENGCYIETIFPLPRDTGITIALDLHGEILPCAGVVRTCDLNVGMGIEFVGLSDTAHCSLHRYLLEHSDQANLAAVIH